MGDNLPPMISYGDSKGVPDGWGIAVTEGRLSLYWVHKEAGCHHFVSFVEDEQVDQFLQNFTDAWTSAKRQQQALLEGAEDLTPEKFNE